MKWNIASSLRILAVSVFIAIGLACSTAAQPKYTIQHISGLQDNFVVRISDAGHVVAGHYLWYQGNLTDLGGLGGGFTAVEDVNASGQVVGRSTDSNGVMHAFVWQNGVMTSLPTLGGQDGYATAINSAGQIVGYTDNSPGPSTINYRATFWTTAHLPVDIGTVPPDHSSFGYAINDLGQVAGVSLPSVGSGFGADAFFWNGTSLTPFIQNQDPLQFAVSDMNNAGQVVGEYHSTAFVWQNGTLTYLGTLGGSFSMADSINSSGQIVGRSTDTNGALHAIVFDHGRMLDLNNLVTNMSEWQYLRIAYDINKSGQIVGVGQLRGGFSDNEVFLLTPVHNPPVIVEASADPSTLWPPNGKMVTVDASVIVQADSDQTSWKIVEVDCNEPLDQNDFEFVDDHTVRLRAARLGSGDGRVYTLWLRASDAFGDISALKAVTVTVPHDSRDVVP